MNCETGRAFAIVPRDIAAHGYFDIDHDDYDEGDILRDLQQECLRVSHRLAVSSSPVELKNLWLYSSVLTVGSRSRAEGRLAEVRRERFYRQTSIGWGNMSRSLVCSEALVLKSWLQANSQRVSVACQLRGKMAFGIPVPKVMFLEDIRANLTCLHPTTSVLDIFYILEYHFHSTFSTVTSCPANSSVLK